MSDLGPLAPADALKYASTRPHGRTAISQRSGTHRRCRPNDSHALPEPYVSPHARRTCALDGPPPTSPPSSPTRCHGHRDLQRAGPSEFTFPRRTQPTRFPSSLLPRGGPPRPNRFRATSPPRGRAVRPPRPTTSSAAKFYGQSGKHGGSVGDDRLCSALTARGADGDRGPDNKKAAAPRSPLLSPPLPSPHLTSR
jgi:hypothetical protein